MIDLRIEEKKGEMIFDFSDIPIECRSHSVQDQHNARAHASRTAEKLNNVKAENEAGIFSQLIVDHLTLERKSDF